MRRWGAAWLTVGCLLASLAIWIRPAPSSLASPEALQVRKIEVVDADGNIRLRLGVATDGTPSVRLYDAAGIRRLELTVADEGPGVTVFDAQGKQRTMLVAPRGLLEAETLRGDGNAGP